MKKKGTIKLTGFLITVVLISMFAGLLGIVISKFSASYNLGYNESTMNKYASKMAEINSQVEDIKNNTSILHEPNLLDIIGSYFSRAYKAVRSTQTTFELYEELANGALDDINLGDESTASGAMNYIKSGLITIMIILIFVGIFISILVKRENI